MNKINKEKMNKGKEERYKDKEIKRRVREA